MVATTSAEGTARLAGLLPGHWIVRLESCAAEESGVGDPAPQQGVGVRRGVPNRVRFELR